jgi:uroporphyrinogen III methyltransferase/synthase
VAAIGSATAERLSSRGIRADLVPETFTAAAVIAALAARQTLAGVRVLLARADIAPKEPADALAARGAIVREVVAYRTVSDFSNSGSVAAALDRGEVDWLTFTSSSTVKNFLDGVGADRIRASRARIASIGPTTSATLRQAGLEATVEAEEHTIPALVEAIVTREKHATDPLP